MSRRFMGSGNRSRPGLSDIARKMLIAIVVIALAGILVSLIYYRSLDVLPFLFGTLLGTAFSVAKVFLLDHTVDKALAMESAKAGGYVTGQHILRMVLSAAALLIGALVPGISIWGAALGILAFQFALYAVRLTGNYKMQPDENKQEGADSLD